MPDNSDVSYYEIKHEKFKKNVSICITDNIQ